MFVVVFALALVALACRGEGASPQGTAESPQADGTSESPQPDGSGNLLLNPGLEDGVAPWISLKPEEGPFSRTDAFAHSGQYSAVLEMADPPQAEGKAKVYYLVQEIAPEGFPEFLSGFYRVENWTKGTRKQYLQFVVIVFGANNLKGGFSNHQIRYPLAGIDSPPFAIGNAHFIFLTREEPVQGQWVPFQANVRDDFERLWGKVPEGFEKIRVLFEVRWDDKTPGAGAGADVYYDDLYFGPAPAASAESDQ